jgi:uncharacterized membrane protein YdbT with pleckstrin-like domain
VNEDFIVLKRQSRRRPQFWFKAIFSLGTWLLWWRSNYLGLTKRSIVRRKGVFTKEERAVPLNQVQDISISYGIIRRILGHGDIRIETAGTSGTEVIMYNIDKPEEFRSKVFEQIDKFFEDEGQAPPKEKNEG